jgi:Tfp pilus assembly protein PilX
MRNFRSQSGIVMIFALMAIVLLALSAVALMRSVDTGNITAGNMAFKQRTVLAAEYGVNAAMSKFDSTSTPAGLLSGASSANSDSVDNCYRSTGFNGKSADATDGSDLRGIPNIVLKASDFDTKYPSCKVTTTTGESIRYVIDRRCSVTGAPTEVNCNVASISTTAQTDADKHTGSEVVPLFRVTARVDGARSTVSYIQVVFRP